MKRIFHQLVALAMTLSAGFRVTMDATLYQIREQMAGLEGEIGSVKLSIAKDAGNPAVQMDDLRGRRQRAEDLQERYNMLADQARELEEAARARLSEQGGGETRMSREEARGIFYRAALLGEDVRRLPRMVYEQLGAIPEADADQGHGSNLLPRNMSSELLLDPMVEHPLLSRMSVTNITGLDLPKLGFSLADDDFVAKDGASAKELKASADGMIKFGRNKMALMAKVSESVLRGSPLNIESAITGALRSQQAAKLLKVTFAASPKLGEEHMSLYAGSTNAIKEVEGPTLLKAIMAAYGDLEDAYVPQAAVVMRRIDWVNMLFDLANGAQSLFGKKPEDIIGVPVVWCEYATVPVVGDFRYLHLNYDIPALYDTDKDVEAGNRIFVLTEWYDQRVKMKAAFRKVKVEVAGG